MPVSSSLDRALDVAGFEQRLAEHLPGRERVGRGSHGALRPRQRRLGVAAVHVLERDLYQRPRVLRLQLELFLEFLDGLVRLLLEQKHAVGVVNVRHFGVAGDEGLKRLVGRGRVPRGHQMTCAPGHEHHLAALRGEFRRQQRQPQRRDAHRFDNTRVVVALTGELAECFERLLVLFGSRHQNRRVIPRDTAEVGCVADT